MSWAWTKLFVDLPVLGLEYEIKNSDRLMSDKPCVIVSNHQSSLDAIGMENFLFYITRLCSRPIGYSAVSDYAGHEFVITAPRKVYFYVDLLGGRGHTLVCSNCRYSDDFWRALKFTVW